MNSERKARIAVLLLAAPVCLMALLVLMGWYAKNTSLIQVSPTLAPMQFNTALCLLLSAMGVILMVFKKRRAAGLVGFAIATIALLTLWQYGFKTDLNIDQFFMESYVKTRSFYPGRMSPNTAFCFLLLGIIFILSLFLYHYFLSTACALMVLLVSFTSLLGYAIGDNLLFGIQNLTDMAVHTAMGFFLVGAGTLVFLLYQTRRVPHQKPANIAMFIVMVVLTSASFAISNQIQKQTTDLRRALFQDEVELAISTLRYKLSDHVNALRRMAERMKGSDSAMRDRWQKDAQEYLEGFPALTSIAWIDADYETRWLEPREAGNIKAGLYYPPDDQTKAILGPETSGRKISFISHADLARHIQAFSVYVPFFSEGVLGGFVTGTYRADIMFQDIQSRSNAQLFNLHLKVGEQILFKNADFNPDKDILSRHIRLFDRTWTLELHPNDLFYEKYDFFTPILILLGGLLIALLAGAFTYTSIESLKSSMALSKNEARLAAILETAPDGILTVNARRKILSINTAISEIFGYSEAELIGESIHKLIPEKYHTKHKANFAAFIKSGVSGNMVNDREVYGLHKDGRIIPLDIGLARIAQPKGPVQVSAIIRDITERVESSKQIKGYVQDLKHSNKVLEDFHYILETSLNEIYIFDPKTLRFIFVNESAQANMGYTMSELGKLTPVDIKPDYSQKQFEKVIKPLLDEKKEKISFKTRHRRKDKSDYTVQVHLQLSHFKNKKAFVAIILDVTENEKLIEQLTDSNEQLEKFAYVCSHDLQEPLRMIQSFSSKLKDHMSDTVQNDENSKRYLDFILDGAERSQNLISDILAYSRIESSTKKLELLNINELMALISENMATQLEERGGKITYDALPEVKGNKTQIFQLFQNLVNNGLKYQNLDKPPHIHVSADDMGEFYQFEIRDNGIGIAQKNQDKIFEVFKRLHRRDQYPGTGIGLSICKKIVERHGGQIWVDSEPGQGSRFYFTIRKARGR